MVDNGLLVTISGVAHSLLYYENVRSVGDQMGFLIGEVLTYVTKNVTDADRQIESKKIHIDIQDILPCPSTGLMYDSGGRVNESLNEFVGKKRREIIGWYRFRINSSLNPTLRDRILHKEFEHLFHHFHTEHTFITCMMNYATINRGGTHKFRHVFLQFMNGEFRPIPSRINNLGADASRHDGSDYKPTPIRHNIEQDYFTKLVNSIELNSGSSGIDTIMEIQNAAEHRLEFLVQHVSNSDRDVALLEEQVRKLRDWIRQYCSINVEKRPIHEHHSSGEPHCHNNKLKKVNEQDNKMTTEVHVKNPAISTNINNACYELGHREPKSPPRKSYREAMNNKSDMTDG